MKEKNSSKKSQTDWDRLKKMKDDDIDLSDMPEVDDNFFKNAKLRLPQTKSMISLRIDPDILDWFKSQGKGYQTRINSVLRMYMESKSA